MATILTRLDFMQHYADYRQGLFILLDEKLLPKDQPPNRQSAGCDDILGTLQAG